MRSHMQPHMLVRSISRVQNNMRSLICGFDIRPIYTAHKLHAYINICTTMRKKEVYVKSPGAGERKEDGEGGRKVLS
jgi:hypothetical protein